MIVNVNRTSISKAIEEWLAKRWSNPPKVMDVKLTSVGPEWYLAVLVNEGTDPEAQGEYDDRSNE